MLDHRKIGPELGRRLIDSPERDDKTYLIYVHFYIPLSADDVAKLHHLGIPQATESREAVTANVTRAVIEELSVTACVHYVVDGSRQYRLLDQQRVA